MKAVMKAWMLTITELATKIQNHAMPLNDLLGDRGAWSHHWRDMELAHVGGRASSSSAAPCEYASVGIPADIVESMANQAKLVKTPQGKFDRLQNRPSGVAAAIATANPAAKATAQHRVHADGTSVGKRRRGGKGGRP